MKEQVAVIYVGKPSHINGQLCSLIGMYGDVTMKQLVEHQKQDYREEQQYTLNQIFGGNK